MLRKISTSLSVKGDNLGHKRRLLEISDKTTKQHDQNHHEEHRHRTDKKKAHGHASVTHSQETSESADVCLLFNFAFFLEGILFIVASASYLLNPTTKPGNSGPNAREFYECVVIVVQSTIIIICITFVINFALQSDIDSTALNTENIYENPANENDSVSTHSYLAGLGYNLSKKMKQVADLNSNNDNGVAPSIVMANTSMSSAHISSLQSGLKTANKAGNLHAEDLGVLKEEENANDGNSDNKNNNNNNNGSVDKQQAIIAPNLNAQPSGGRGVKTFCLLGRSVFELLSLEWTEFNLVGMCGVSYYLLTAILYFSNSNKELHDGTRILRGVGNLLSAFGFVLPGICIHLSEKRLTSNRRCYIDFSKTVGPDELGIISEPECGHNSRVGIRNRSGIEPNGRIGGVATAVGSGGSHKPHDQLNTYQHVHSSNANENGFTNWFNSGPVRTWFVAVFLMHLVMDLSLIFVQRNSYYKGIYYTYFDSDFDESPSSLQRLIFYLNYIFLRPFSIVLIINTIVLTVALSFDWKYRNSQFVNLKEIFTPFLSISVIFLVVVELILRSNKPNATLVVGLIWIGVFIVISVFECYILLTLLDMQDAAKMEHERLYGYKNTKANILLVVGGIVLGVTLITILLLCILKDKTVDKEELIQPFGIVYFNLTQIIMVYPLKTIEEVPSFLQLSCCCCFVCILHKNFRCFLVF